MVAERVEDCGEGSDDSGGGAEAGSWSEASNNARSSFA